MPILSTLESIFKTYSFAKQVILVVFGAVFGGFCTTIINSGAMRRQCRFNMQYEILKAESANITELYKHVETLEIGLSFGNGETADYVNEIDAIRESLLKLNERLRDERKYVRKYLSATIVEKSAQYVSDYMKILYKHGQNGILDFKILKKVDSNVIARFREFERNVLSLSDDISDSMENLISPGVLSKIKRKLRKPGMIIEDCFAIWKVHHQKK